MPNPLTPERLAEIDEWLGYMPLLQVARDLRVEVTRLRKENVSWRMLITMYAGIAQKEAAEVERLKLDLEITRSGLKSWRRKAQEQEPPSDVY